MKERIPRKFNYKGMDWVVSRQYPHAKGEEPQRLIATDKPTDDYGKRDYRMIKESELRALLPQHPRSTGARRT